MTLNDNPRVDAERRFRVLLRRRERVRRIRNQMHWPKGFDLADGWDYNKLLCQSHKARFARLLFLIDGELAAVRRVLKAFGWNDR